MTTTRSLLTFVVLFGFVIGQVAAQPQSSQQDLSEQLDVLQSSVVGLSKNVEDNKGWTTKDVLTSIGGVAAMILAIIAGVNVWVALCVSRRTATMFTNEKTATHIQEKLDQFYGPFRQLRNQSTLLYKAFKEMQPNPASFRNTHRITWWHQI